MHKPLLYKPHLLSRCVSLYLHTAIMHHLSPVILSSAFMHFAKNAPIFNSSTMVELL
jgi:hypothetical protein